VKHEILRIGAAKVSITPKERVFLAGFDRNRVSEGVHDEIYLRAVTFEHEDDKLILISADLIGLLKDFIDSIRRRAAKIFNVKESHIICCCTHTHSGPDTIGLWGPNYFTPGLNEMYMEELKRKFLLVINKALENMQDAIVKYSWKWIEPRGIVKNARDPYIVDRYLAVIRIENLSGKSIATIVNFACHPEVLDTHNKLITSDYPHYLRDYIERKIGGIAIFFNGALGGMLTPDVRMRDFNEAKRVGEKLGREVVMTLAGERELKEIHIRVKNTKLRIPQRNKSFEEALRKGLIKRRMFGSYIETEISLVNIGEISIATLPGEALPRIGIEIRGGMNGKCKLILGLANDEIGYIIPSDSWDDSKYEESMSLGPETADIILEELYKMITLE